MTHEVLRSVGQIAGIGGIALGVLLLIFREVVRKNIFPNLTKQQGYSLLRLILILVWTVALAGLASWVYVSNTSRSAPTQSSGEDPSASSPTAEDIAERGVILINLGYALYAFGLGTDAAPEELDISRMNAELSGLYDRLGLAMPEADVGLEMFNTTKSMLLTERDRQCLEVGAEIGAVSSIGLVMVFHRGTEFEETGKQTLPRVVAALKNDLKSLGILELVEQDRGLESCITPKQDDSKDAYDERVVEVKASIIGAYRQRYAAMTK